MLRKSFYTLGFVVAATLSQDALADARANSHYEVTITNLSHGTLFTPALLVSHAKGINIFTEGEPASAELKQLAEGGATQPLQDAIYATGKAYDAVSSGPILPGKSVTLQVQANRGAHYLTLASMLLPTNDGFIALDGVEGPEAGDTAVIYLPAYDAGSEVNDELCSHIPGPHCGGEGYSNTEGEGFVHIHSGIHGQGDLSASDYDWNNPVAKVTITRMR